MHAVLQKREGKADSGRQGEDTWAGRRKEEPSDAAEHGALMGSDPAPNSPPSFPSSGAEQKADFPFLFYVMPAFFDVDA